MGAAERAAITDAVARVIRDGPWILGPVVEQFEREFGTYFGGLNVVGVGNGTDALAIAFAALDLPPGAGVLVAANEGGYAATALRLEGLTPVVMDVDDVTRRQPRRGWAPPNALRSLMPLRASSETVPGFSAPSSSSSSASSAPTSEA